MDLGKRLRQYRLRRNMSLYDVERATGLHYSTVGKYERGERTPPLHVLKELARVYQVPLQEMVGESLEEAPGGEAQRDAWLRQADYVRVRPDLGRLVDAAAPFPPEWVQKLADLLEEAAPPNRERDRR
ncbi:MAG: helix-turn-helix transcriptional regulator [Bacillota bacterium]|nr:helix-turn-helix transcriptional regulator [Bacillota bacterium]